MDAVNTNITGKLKDTHHIHGIYTVRLCGAMRHAAIEVFLTSVDRYVIHISSFQA